MKFKVVPVSEKVASPTVGSVFDGTSFVAVRVALNSNVPCACALRAQASKASITMILFKVYRAHGKTAADSW